MDTQGARNTFEKKAVLADFALDILQEYVPEKKSLLSSLEGKKLIDKEDYDQIAAQQEELINAASRITGWQKEMAECRANIQKLENQIEALTPWMSLDVPVSFDGTKSVKALIGTISSVMSLEEIYSLLAQYAPEAEEVDVTILSAERDAIRRGSNNLNYGSPDYRFQMPEWSFKLQRFLIPQLMFCSERKFPVLRNRILSKLWRLNWRY